MTVELTRDFAHPLSGKILRSGKLLECTPDLADYLLSNGYGRIINKVRLDRLAELIQLQTSNHEEEE
jgi:hypothetical protein